MDGGSSRPFSTACNAQGKGVAQLAGIFWIWISIWVPLGANCMVVIATVRDYSIALDHKIWR